jgi:hydrogenase maturation protease
MGKKIAIIGSGNAFFKDEGIGLYGAKYLKENYTFNQEVEIVDGGTLGFKLMPLLQEFDEVIIINTASDEETKAGEITIKTTEEFLDGALVKKTANEVEIAEMLQICSMSENMAKVSVISIVPDDILSVEIGLSEIMHESWQSYIETVLERLKVLGVDVQAKAQHLSLEDILLIFANPSIEHNRGF